MFLFTIKQREITEKTTKLSCLDVYKHVGYTEMKQYLQLLVNSMWRRTFLYNNSTNRDLHELYNIAFTSNCLPSMSDKPLAIYCSCGAVQYGSCHHPVMTTVLFHHDFGTPQRLTGYIFFAVLLFSNKTKCCWHGQKALTKKKNNYKNKFKRRV